jgi:uncharacterized membrane protein YdbT with pleckstrin-like domain
MSFIEKNLIAGESVLYRTRLHWVASVRPISWSLALDVLAVAIIVLPQQSWMHLSRNVMLYAVLLGALLLCVAMLVAMRALWQRNATQMVVTNKRVIVKQGLVSSHSTEITLEKIESIVVDQSAMGRIFDFGTVIVRGVGGTPEPFEKIDHPLELRRQVQQQIDKNSGTAAEETEK